MTSNEKYVPRVTQLDAVELDDEIVNILKHQVITVTRYMPVGFLGKWEPEIDALLRYIIWKFSVNKVYSTFGQQLLSVKYGGDYNKTKAHIFALLTIGCKYMKQRSHEIATASGDQNLSEKIKFAFHWSDVCIQLANLVNLLVFLREGTYPRLVDRVLGLQPVSMAPSGQNRTVGYSYMTRELLWHGFIELLIFIVPLMNYHSMRRRILNLFSWRRTDNINRHVVFTLGIKCAECNETPVLPHYMGCSHVFCYYCIKANHLADEKYQCPLCGFSAENVSSVAPLYLH